MSGHLTDAQRQDFAMRALIEPVAQIAKEAGVRPQTVYGWMKKFSAAASNAITDSLAGASLAQDGLATGQEDPRLVMRGTPRPVAMLDAERRTLRQLPRELDADYPWWVTPGAFAPRSFTDQLGRIAEAHRAAETPRGAVDGMVSAVGSLKHLVASATKTAERDVADRIQGHAQQLQAIIEACAVKAETRGAEGALRLLNDALAGWGATGVDPERLTRRGSVPVWEERRLRAEAALDPLSRLLSAHPEYERRLVGKARCSRHGNRVTADARFDKCGRDIFRTPFELMADDWDYPDLVGRDILTEMAKRVAATTGLDIGTDAKVVVIPSEKGWVEVGYEIMDPDPPETPEHPQRSL